MRAVERTPWAAQRSETHDYLCRVVVACEEKRGWKCELEAPCGPGFCDVLCIKKIDNGQLLCASIFEVKTRDETFSGGDLVRQLKWYREQLRKGNVRFDEIRMTAVFEDEAHVTDGIRRMLEHEGIGITWGSG